MLKKAGSSLWRGCNRKYNSQSGHWLRPGADRKVAILFDRRASTPLNIALMMFVVLLNVPFPT